jgi:hypothetical protein
MFSLFVNKLIGFGKDVVFIAHATEDKNDTLTLVRPDQAVKIVKKSIALLMQWHI